MRQDSWALSLAFTWRPKKNEDEDNVNIIYKEGSEREGKFIFLWFHFGAFCEELKTICLYLRWEKQNYGFAFD